MGNLSIFLFLINQGYGTDSNFFNLPIFQSANRIQEKTQNTRYEMQCSGCELRNIILHSNEKCQEKNKFQVAR